jgi:hypothetical protein
MGFAGALLLAMSTSLFAVDAIRDAGSKVRGEWLGAAQPTASVNQGVIYRSYNVAPAPMVAAAPAAPMMAAAPAAPSSNAVRSFSYQPQVGAYGSAVRTAPYLRADHKILGLYGD